MTAGRLFVTQARFKRARSNLVDRSVVGFADVELNHELRLHGFVVRRLDGKYSVELPARRDRRGRQHEVVRATELVRERLAAQVLQALRAEGRLP